MVLLFADSLLGYGADSTNLLQNGKWFSKSGGTSQLIYSATGGPFNGPYVGTVDDSHNLVSPNWTGTLSRPSPSVIRGTVSNPIHGAFYYRVNDPVTDIPSEGPFMGFEYDESLREDRFNLQLRQPEGRMLVSAFDATAPAENTNRGYTQTNICDGQWHHIEFKWSSSNTVGIVQVWVDGNLEIDFSGDTLADGVEASPGIETFRFYGSNLSETHFAMPVIWDEEAGGLDNTGQLGPHRIDTIRPDGPGNRNNFTANGGTTNDDRVSEALSDDATTVNTSNATGDDDLYTYGNMNYSPQTIHTLAIQSRMTNIDTGASHQARVLIRSSTSEATGTSHTLSPSGTYDTFYDERELDPQGGGAWTEARINAAEFGVENVT